MYVWEIVCFTGSKVVLYNIVAGPAKKNILYIDKVMSLIRLSQFLGIFDYVSAN